MFRGGVYDLVIFSEVIEHLKDDNKALRDIYKVLKPKGNFLVKTFDNPMLKEYLKKLNKNFSYVKVFKPKVSKKRSNEIYIVAKSKHNR